MERSFGIIPLQKSYLRWKTLLVKHGKGHWAFPKGHLNPNETPQEAAIRELKEETNLEVKQFLPLKPLREFYVFKREGILVEKIVTYYLAEVTGSVKLQEEEITDYRWVFFEEAIELATFPDSKDVARDAFQLLESEGQK